MARRQRGGEVHVEALWGQPKPLTVCGQGQVCEGTGLCSARMQFILAKTPSLC